MGDHLVPLAFRLGFSFKFLLTFMFTLAQYLTNYQLEEQVHRGSFGAFICQILGQYF